MKVWKELKDRTDQEIIDELTERYKPTEIPPCRICGGKLSIGKIGGGEPTIWACAGTEDDPDRPGFVRRKKGRNLADRHYSDSEFIDRR